ncbi:hypothetical protein ONR57_08950 [Hoyosella sp. YIM 151337]|nr:hypothetical protein [Hoyosella sp. YIM 151337]MCW4353423.1 hypothetical protein [Hoyosella sp. YIM 151337]
MNTYSVRMHETFIHTFTIRAETAEEAEDNRTRHRPRLDRRHT